jgi:hypothetical protein
MSSTLRPALVAALVVAAISCATERRERPDTGPPDGDGDADGDGDGDADGDGDSDGDGDGDADGDGDSDGDGDGDGDSDADGDGDGDADGDVVGRGVLVGGCVTGPGHLWRIDVEQDRMLVVEVDTLAVETAADLWAYISSGPGPEAPRPVEVDDAWDCTYPPACTHRGLCPRFEARVGYSGPRFLFVGIRGFDECCPDGDVEYELRVTQDGAPVPPELFDDDAWAEPRQ